MLADGAMPHPAVAPPPARPRVVLVDDDAEVRESISEVLAAAGYEVAAFSSAAETLAAGARVAGTRVLIADIVLGDGPDGFALAGRLAGSVPDLAVVYITGHFTAQANDRVRPNDRLLRKPFGIAELLATVAELAGSPASGD